MSMLITDPSISDRLKAERVAAGADVFDEVWEGVYVMSPMADDEHQDIQLGFAAAIKAACGWDSGTEVRAGVNVSDRVDDWTQNYRVPDVAVFLPGGQAVNCGTHWRGGPDLVVEVISPFDQTRQKLPIYESIGVREVLLVDRNPWALELHRLSADRKLVMVARIPVASTESLQTTTVPLSMRLLDGTPRPRIELTQRGTAQRWLI
jgi:Uma2 family endonuclease